METVEKTTTAIPAAQIEDAPARTDAQPIHQPPDVREEMLAKPATSAAHTNANGSTTDAWAGLLTTGLDLLGQILSSAQSPAPSVTQSAPTKGLSIVRRDERTGESYLHLPMPGPETMERLLGAVSTLLEKFASRR